jgi:hypothetical protein
MEVQLLRVKELAASSKLENQRSAGVTLIAVEGTIRDKGVELNPLSYFSVLVIQHLL